MGPDPADAQSLWILLPAMTCSMSTQQTHDSTDVSSERSHELVGSASMGPLAYPSVHDTWFGPTAWPQATPGLAEGGFTNCRYAGLGKI